MIRNFAQFLILISIFTTFAYSQTKSNDDISRQIKSLKVDKVFTLTYDKDGANSKILAFCEDFGSAQDARAGVQVFYFGMSFFYPGKVLTNAPETINLTFMVLAKKPKFAESNHLIITSGGENIDIGDARYAAKRDKNMEYLNFEVARDDLVKLAKTSTASLKIGTADFQFKSEQLRVIGAFMKISDPTERP